MTTMRTLPEIVRAFLAETPKHAAYDDTVAAFIAEAGLNGLPLGDDLALARLLQAVRDHALAEAIDGVHGHVEAPVAVEVMAALSPQGRHVFDTLRQRGIPVTNRPDRLLRAWGTSQRPSR